MTTTTEPELNTDELAEINRSLLEQLRFKEFQLSAMGHLADVIDYAPSPVWTGQATAMTIRDFLSCGSIEELKTLAERKRSNA